MRPAPDVRVLEDVVIICHARAEDGPVVKDGWSEVIDKMIGLSFSTRLMIDANGNEGEIGRGMVAKYHSQTSSPRHGTTEKSLAGYKVAASSYQTKRWLVECGCMMFGVGAKTIVTLAMDMTACTSS